MGSRSGRDEHPAWYLNLRDHPDCEIRVASLHMKARAEELQGEERARAWAKVTREQPIYQTYQARTEREIPVIRLSALT